MLTDNEINDVFEGVHGYRLEQWELDEGDVPVMKLSRAIESAATAPLLARIADLEAENFKVSAALNYHKDKCAVLTRELEEARKDAELLDFIESMGKGVPWIARQSSLGRGYRLHNDKHGTHITARGAIRAAIKEQT